MKQFMYAATIVVMATILFAACGKGNSSPDPGGNPGGGGNNKVESVSLKEATLSLDATVAASATGQLTATVKPDNAANKKITWSSSDEKIATVDADGKVTAVGIGTATITATSAADANKKAPCTVAVSASGKTGNLTWKITEAGDFTLSGTGAMPNYKRIDESKPIDETDTDAPWNKYKASIKSVTIDDRITSIGDFAFFYCSGLTSIAIPDKVTSIGYGAFALCIRLARVTIPLSVTSIGVGAFVYCSGLTSVTIPNGVTSIGDEAFSFSGLTSIAIPDKVTGIGDYAFADCDGIKNVTIGSGVTSIGNSAFARCSKLASVTIGSGVKSIRQSAFDGCSQLATVTIQATSPPTLEGRAFAGNANPNTLLVPKTNIFINGFPQYVLAYNNNANWKNSFKTIAEQK
jgi:hypothetical protein